MEIKIHEKSISCLACSNNAHFLFKARDENRHFSGYFNYFRCQTCRLVFIDRIPDDIGRYYGGGYQAIPSSEADIRPLSENEAYRLKAILKYKTSGKLLEIGPWIGLFSYAAKRAGFDVSTIELNEDCVRFLREALEIRTFQSADPAVTLASMTERFDIIVLWHSIEHLPRPWDVIRAASERLNPNGILVVAAPNPESEQFRILGKHWYHLDAPRHLYLLPSSLVMTLGMQGGLEFASTTTKDQLGQTLTRIGWHHFLGRFVPIPGFRRLVKTIFSPLLSKIFRENREGSGAGYTTIMKKTG